MTVNRAVETRKPSDEELGKYLRKEWDLRRRFMDGSLPPGGVLDEIQAIMTRTIKIVKIVSLVQLSNLESPTIGQLKQLISELKIWSLLEEVDQLTKNQRVKIQPFLSQLWIEEEKESDYGYPSNWQPKQWQEQEKVFQKLFPQLNISHIKTLVSQLTTRPEGADSKSYAIPKPYQYFIKVLGGVHSLEEFYEVDESGCFIHPYYQRALEGILRELKKVRNDFFNYREGELTLKYLRLTEKTRKAYMQMEQEFPGDYMVFWAQLGLHHRGRSARRARIIFAANETGLCPFAVAAILIAHPERLKKYEHLTINCVGSEYSLGNLSDYYNFSYFLGFAFGEDKLRFTYGSIDNADGGIGPSTLFLK